MDFGLEGRAALVTAGSNGIGEGAAVTLARFGADIAIADIDVENGERVCAAIRAMGRRAFFVATNAMEAEQVEAAVEATAKEFGRLDVLVNNAGGSKPRPFMDQRHSNWQRVIDLNFTSMLAATQSASRHMIAGGGGGSIVNVASSEGFRAAPNYSVYAACKAGMIGFTKTMALELAEHGIRVNCIAPDGIDTPGIRPHGAVPEDERRSRHIPMRRHASIEEAGTVIAALASNLMSYVTGATVPVDGGIGAAGGWIKTDTGWGFGT